MTSAHLVHYMGVSLLLGPTGTPLIRIAPPQNGRSFVKFCQNFWCSFSPVFSYFVKLQSFWRLIKTSGSFLNGKNQAKDHIGSHAWNFQCHFWIVKTSKKFLFSEDWVEPFWTNLGGMFGGTTRIRGVRMRSYVDQMGEWKFPIGRDDSRECPVWVFPREWLDRRKNGSRKGWKIEKNCEFCLNRVEKSRNRGLNSKNWFIWHKKSI